MGRFIVMVMVYGPVPPDAVPVIVAVWKSVSPKYSTEAVVLQVATNSCARTKVFEKENAIIKNGNGQVYSFFIKWIF